MPNEKVVSLSQAKGAAHGLGLTQFSRLCPQQPSHISPHPPQVITPQHISPVSVSAPLVDDRMCVSFLFREWTVSQGHGYDKESGFRK